MKLTSFVSPKLIPVFVLAACSAGTVAPRGVPADAGRTDRSVAVATDSGIAVNDSSTADGVADHSLLANDSAALDASGADGGSLVDQSVGVDAKFDAMPVIDAALPIDAKVADAPSVDLSLAKDSSVADAFVPRCASLKAWSCSAIAQPAPDPTPLPGSMAAAPLALALPAPDCTMTCNASPFTPKISCGATWCTCTVSGQSTSCKLPKAGTGCQLCDSARLAGCCGGY